MKKVLLSVLMLAGVSVFAQDNVMILESHTLNGESVVFEGKDANTGEYISTTPILLDEIQAVLSTNGNNVRYWLFEGCYKYEVATIRKPTAFDGLSTSVSVDNTLDVAKGGILIVDDSKSFFIENNTSQEKTGSLVKYGQCWINASKEWVKPCPSH